MSPKRASKEQIEEQVEKLVRDGLLVQDGYDEEGNPKYVVTNKGYEQMENDE